MEEKGERARILLGLSPNCEPNHSQLKAAYRRKVWESHPDLFPPHLKPLAESNFKSISEAYSFLLSPSPDVTLTRMLELKPLLKYGRCWRDVVIVSRTSNGKSYKDLDSVNLATKCGFIPKPQCAPQFSHNADNNIPNQGHGLWNPYAVSSRVGAANVNKKSINVATADKVTDEA
uniref:J domain-containing protein n=1 Tax=Cannabis sativa TaxID=3483 RepID=A0A803NQ01_CANSA